MKSKLKMLFAYFRPLGETITTTISFDVDEIEDWNENFTLDNKKTINPPTVIINVINDLIDIYGNDFQNYNDYNTDTWWYLEITIKPRLNTINFRSVCKFENTEFKEFQMDTKDYPRLETLLTTLDENEDFEGGTKLEFYIIGRWDGYDVREVYSDDYKIKTVPDLIFDIGNLIMVTHFNNNWDAEYGHDATILIWGEDVYVDANQYTDDYQETELNLTITPENIIERNEE